MRSINFPLASEKLAATMDEVVANNSPVVITREGSPSVVMLSLDDYASMEETVYLFSSPANGQRLIESIRALEKGEGIVRDAAGLLKP